MNLKIKSRRPVLFILFVLSLLLFSPRLVAQQNHFIYIQTDNKQPFYIKQDKKIFSSSATGYLILSKLTGGTYNLIIGFPKNEWPEQTIRCTIVNKDIGYSLKNMGDKGWGLFNLQTMDLVMAGTYPLPVTLKQENTDDPFNNMLSNAVNDPSIKEKRPAKETPIQESKIPKQDNRSGMHIVPDISKILSTSNNEGTEMIFIDNTSERPDTIRLFIPADKSVEATLPEPIKEDAKKRGTKKRRTKKGRTQTGNKR